MSGNDAFEVEGVIVEVQANGTYRVELANGHRLLGFVAGKRKQNQVRLATGDRVKLKLSSYDLSAGRILLDRPAVG